MLPEGRCAPVRTLIALHDQVVELRHPPCIAANIEFLYRDSIVSSGQAKSCIIIEKSAHQRYAVRAEPEVSVDNLTAADLPTFIMEAVVRGLIKDLHTAVALHAGAVAYNGNAALIAGPTGSGKSSLVAWLIDKGFEYLSDEIALLVAGSDAVIGLPRALVLKPGSTDEVLALPAHRDAKRLAGGECTFLRWGPTVATPSQGVACSLIVFPEFAEGSQLSLQSISAGQAALRLVGCNLNARNLADGGFRAITELARRTPAVTLRYSSFEQLHGKFDELARLLLGEHLDAAAGRRFLSLFAPSPVHSAPSTAARPTTYKVPGATPRAAVSRRLTIGMATYDDYDGVYFSLQALRLYHPEILPKTDFLVIDNHPDGPCAEPLKALEGNIPNFRYVPVQSRAGTAVRDSVFAETNSDFVLCMDCHVFVVPGALKRLLDYFDAHNDTIDLLQGPLLYDDLSSISTHFCPTWRGGMYGYWDTDQRGLDPDAPPFDIPMQGLGLFCCRRSVWPGFNPRFRGFGGEEGYIHAKFRHNGGRTLCLPFLRWMHRFQRPLGVPYSNRWDDRVRNYMIGFTEFGLPTAELEQHFGELLGSAAGPLFKQIKQELKAGA